MKSSRRTIASGALVSLALLLLTACGGSGSSTSSASSTASESPSGSSESSAGSAAQKAAAQWFKGSYTLPTVKPFKVPRDKILWLIPFGSDVQPAQRNMKAITEAAEPFGWTVHVYDGKFEPNEYLAGIRSAIAAHADAIWTYVIDCSDIVPALKEAKAAGIPVINVQGQDCNEGSEGAPQLFTYDVTFGGKDLTEYFEDYGETSAVWVAAEKPEAKILVFEETDAAVLTDAAIGFKKGIKALCPGCEIVETITFVGGEVGPQLQAKAEQALLKHPDTTILEGSYEDPVVNALVPAIQNAGFTGKAMAVPGEGTVNATELLHEGKIASIVGEEQVWEGYMAFDAIARVLAGRNPAENEANGMGLQLVDKNHNTPPSGQPWKLQGFDFKGAFEKAWLK